MSHFYGTLQGQAGEATRRGSKNSGLTTFAASWSGAVCVRMYVDDNGNDCAHVSLVPWQNGAGTNRVLYDGRVDGKK